MPRKRIMPKTVTWLSEEVSEPQSLTTTFHFYKKFQFNNIIAEIGDFVLVSNADAAEPDTEAGCDAARIISLYEDRTNTSDPFRAKVQWYSRPSDLPEWCLNKMELTNFLEKEVIEDHRPFNTDVSIETFFKKCTITFTFTKDVDINIHGVYHYVCRYRLMNLSRRKVHIEPVLDEERKALALLTTPNKTPSNSSAKTPSSLVKRMSRVSIAEKNWSISKNDGTKLLLKRAILTDKIEKDSPKKATPKTTPKSLKKLSNSNIENILSMEYEKDSPKKVMSKTVALGNKVPKVVLEPLSSTKLSKNNIEDVLSMELRENSDDDLPTLIIRQHTPSTPKRKQSIAKINEETPKKVLVFEDIDMTTPTTRSGRKKAPISYTEEEISPVKRTPRRPLQKICDDDDDFKPAPRTPRTPKTPKVKTPAQTPKRSVSKRILVSQLTPSLSNRANVIDNIDDFLKENKSLPGRESQMEEILSFVRTKLLDGTSGCMYISGVPGTGKTATVCSALKYLKEEIDLPDFQLVEVNGMRIAEPRQAYVQIYKQLTGKSVVWEQACSLLEKRFTNPGSKRIPTVLLVDELDALCTRRQDVLYSIMEWAAHNTALLTVLAVANTMDLPERALAARVASRLGLTRLTFPPYSHTQLQKIVIMRLAGANVTADAVQLIARKVAAVSGDARRALALCTRALELAGPEGAGLKEVQQALGEAASSAAVRAIKQCSPAERLMLRAVAAEVERTGSDETTISRALLTAAAIVALDGRPYKSAPSIRAPTTSQAQAICARLASLRLLLIEPKPSEPRLLLNISADDVHYATRQITV